MTISVSLLGDKPDEFEPAEQQYLKELIYFKIMICSKVK